VSCYPTAPAVVLTGVIYPPWLTHAGLVEYEEQVPLNIKNADVEHLVDEVARLAGESKTEAVRRALEERRERLAFRVVQQDRAGRLREFLEQHVWPRVPRRQLGRRLSRRQEEALLGYGPRGV